MEGIRAGTLRSTIPAPIWDELVRGAPTTHTAAGEPVYIAGSLPPVLAILEGSARVVIHSDDGREVTLIHAHEGDVLGLAPNLAELATMSAQAESPLVAARLSMSRVRQVATQHPELAWAMAAQVARWSAEAIDVVLHAGARPVTARLAEHLLELTGSGQRGTAQAHVTHKTLAGAVGTAREVVTRTLAALRSEGVVDTRPGVVLVLDRARLEAVAVRGNCRQM